MLQFPRPLHHPNLAIDNPYLNVNIPKSHWTIHGPSPTPANESLKTFNSHVKHLKQGPFEF